MGELDRPDSFTARLADWFEHGSLEIDTGRRMMRVKPHIPDELFFPTALMKAEGFGSSSVPDYRLLGSGSDDIGSGSSGSAGAGGSGTKGVKMNAMHYIRMDEHYPWSNFAQRYEAPGDGTGRAWGPYYLGTYDLKDIKDSGALFIRKVSPLVDANILRILPVDDHSLIPDISWPGTSEC